MNCNWNALMPSQTAASISPWVFMVPFPGYMPGCNVLGSIAVGWFTGSF
jgi:hypothetical protein